MEALNKKQAVLDAFLGIGTRLASQTSIQAIWNHDSCTLMTELLDSNCLHFLFKRTVYTEYKCSLLTTSCTGISMNDHWSQEEYLAKLIP